MQLEAHDHIHVDHAQITCDQIFVYTINLVHAQHMVCYGFEGEGYYMYMYELTK